MGAIALPGLSAIALCSLLPAVLATGAVCARAVSGLSRTGPRLREEILGHYRLYAAWAFVRLSAWAFIICSACASVGVIAYLEVAIILGLPFHVVLGMLAGCLGMAVAVSLQFLRHLTFLPASIAASASFRLTRLHPLADRLTPARLRVLTLGTLLALVSLFVAAATAALMRSEFHIAALLTAFQSFTALLWTGAWVELAPKPHRSPTRSPAPNVLMIGSDSLRADRIGRLRRGHSITPAIDRLASSATLFTNCHVPCARTAPALASLFTGTWPQTHGIRDNFFLPDQIPPALPSLVREFQRQGYRTRSISDWSGSDFRKLGLGFDRCDVPDDQWNLRYLLRQGPQDLRLFLSLFTHNRFGRVFLPELHFLAGVPLTSEIGTATRRALSELARDGQPFLLNVFMATTHAPFGSEYPYFRMFAEGGTGSESRFVMTQSADLEQVVLSQQADASQFDVPQIMALYDACVRRFDDEVAAILEHLRRCDLDGNTIVVVYSDHGFEFFEAGSWGQGNSVVSDASTQVPVLIRDPRRPGSGCCDRLIRLIDVAPTLLALAGMPAVPGMQGVSLVRYLEDRDADLELVAYAETGLWLTKVSGLRPDHARYPDIADILTIPDRRAGTLALKPEFEDVVVGAKDRSVRTQRWKLVYQPLVEGYALSLYDVVADPACRRDVAAEHPRVRDALWQVLRPTLNGRIDREDLRSPGLALHA